jgi:hypothetical protein
MAAVSALPNSSPRNLLLAAMSAADFASLQPHLQPVAMELLKELERPNRRIPPTSKLPVKGSGSPPTNCARR